MWNTSELSLLTSKKRGLQVGFLPIPGTWYQVNSHSNGMIGDGKERGEWQKNSKIFGVKEHLKWVEPWRNYEASARGLVTSWIWGILKIGVLRSGTLKS